MLKLENISKIYRTAGRRLEVLRGLNLNLNAAEIIAITGKSGSGKTTLLNIITGLTTPSSGTVKFHNKKLNYFLDIIPAHIRNRKIGFIFQTFRLIQKESVIGNILLPARIKGVVNSTVKKRADLLLEELGIPEYKQTPVGYLSGGQKQRVAIARALINDPDLILADEPTANLDVETSESIFSILNDLKARNKAILIVTHKESMHKRADRRYSMQAGILEELQ